MTNPIYQFCVSEETFTLSERTLSKPHLSDDTFPDRVRSRENNQPPYFDGKEKLFRDWCIPYIHFGLYPKGRDIKPFEKEHLIHLTQEIGLDSLAKLLKAQTPPVERKTFKITYTVAHVGLSNPYVSYFNCKKYNSKDKYNIDCPDKGCQATLKGFNPDQVRNHYLSSPHNGTITLLESIKDKQYSKNFLVECIMKDFEEP